MAYCFARPTHEYLGFSAGLDFESKIMVKANAPELLRAELASPKWKLQVLGMSGVTDCYQPIERKLQLTRRCLEVLLDFRNPVCIITKNHLVDHEMVNIIGEAARAGASSGGYVPLRLPFGVKEIFQAWLETHFPEPQRKVAGPRAGDARRQVERCELRLAHGRGEDLRGATFQTVR